MNGVILFYSGTGNTALACQYLARRLPPRFACVDVTLPRRVDLAGVDVVGFAAPTDFWGVPQAFEAFIQSLPPQDGRPAFVFNTYGAASGKTLRILAELVGAGGFEVLAGHSLRMPESYPPMIAARMGAKRAPSRRQLKRLEAFVADLSIVVRASGGELPVARRKVRLGAANAVLPQRPRTTARESMGLKVVDPAACTECGRCARDCPYEAILLAPTPVFDAASCRGCWRCYNNCPAHAISTAKFHGGPFYGGPSDVLKAKLEA
jgi:ferredoxin